MYVYFSKPKIDTYILRCIIQLVQFLTSVVLDSICGYILNTVNTNEDNDDELIVFYDCIHMSSKYKNIS